MKQVITIAAISFHTVFNEKGHNMKRVLEYIEAAKMRGADLILFPEMVISGYEYTPSMKDVQRNFAQSMEEEIVDTVAKKTKECGVYAIFGMPERDKDQFYQSMVVCGPQGYVYTYRKMFLQGKEAFWAQNGNEMGVFETPWGKVGIGLNYDMNNIKLVTDFYKEEVRLCLFPAAIQNHRKEMEQAKAMVEKLVKEARVFVVFANLAGKEKVNLAAGGSAFVLGDLTAPIYGGGSVIAGPGMHTPCHYYAGDFWNGETGIVMAAIDLSHAKIPYQEDKTAEMRCANE